jgi:hypothetical protein
MDESDEVAHDEAFVRLLEDLSAKKLRWRRGAFCPTCHKFRRLLVTDDSGFLMCAECCGSPWPQDGRRAGCTRQVAEAWEKWNKRICGLDRTGLD